MSGKAADAVDDEDEETKSLPNEKVERLHHDDVVDRLYQGPGRGGSTWTEAEVTRWHLVRLKGEYIDHSWTCRPCGHHPNPKQSRACARCSAEKHDDPQPADNPTRAAMAGMADDEVLSEDEETKSPPNNEDNNPTRAAMSGTAANAVLS